MPFKSEKQRRFMWAKKPELAKKWSEEMEAKHQSQKNLPMKKEAGIPWQLRRVGQLLGGGRAKELASGLGHSKYMQESAREAQRRSSHLYGSALDQANKVLAGLNKDTPSWASTGTSFGRYKRWVQEAKEGIREGARRQMPTLIKYREAEAQLAKELAREKALVRSARIGTGAGAAGLGGLGLALGLSGKKKEAGALRSMADLYKLTKEGSPSTEVVKTLLRFKPSTLAAVTGPPLLYLAYHLSKTKPRKTAVDPTSSAADESFAPLPGTGLPSEPL